MTQSDLPFRLKTKDILKPFLARIAHSARDTLYTVKLFTCMHYNRTCTLSMAFTFYVTECTERGKCRPASCRLCGARPEIGRKSARHQGSQGIKGGSSQAAHYRCLSGGRPTAVRPVRIGRHPAGYRRGIAGT